VNIATVRVLFPDLPVCPIPPISGMINSKTIFMSGYTADKIAQEGIPDGCEFIQKPVQPQHLLRKIRQMLDIRVSPRT